MKKTIRKNEIKGFYFAPRDGRLGYGDGRVIRVGRTHKVSGKIIPCENGLHASPRIIDALKHAKSSILYLVSLPANAIPYGEPIEKYAAAERTYLARAKVDELLSEFARRQALINIEKIKPHCSTAEYELIKMWLRTGSESTKSDAYSATSSAACSAYSAYSAADSASYSAASSEYSAASSAYSAARSAACSAYSAYSAASSAACSADYAADYAADSASYSASYSAASSEYSAAYSAADKMLTDMVREKTGWAI